MSSDRGEKPKEDGRGPDEGGGPVGRGSHGTSHSAADWYTSRHDQGDDRAESRSILETAVYRGEGRTGREDALPLPASPTGRAPGGGERSTLHGLGFDTIYPEGLGGGEGRVVVGVDHAQPDGNESAMTIVSYSDLETRVLSNLGEPGIVVIDEERYASQGKKSFSAGLYGYQQKFFDDMMVKTLELDSIVTSSWELKSGDGKTAGPVGRPRSEARIKKRRDQRRARAVRRRSER